MAVKLSTGLIQVEASKRSSVIGQQGRIFGASDAGSFTVAGHSPGHPPRCASLKRVGRQDLIDAANNLQNLLL